MERGKSSGDAASKVKMAENKYKFYNEDCIEGCRRYIKDDSVDLIITDPPYGINGDQLHKHYNRNEDNVIEGYIEVPKEEYAGFSDRWIKEAERILKPGGSIYIVSGYTNLIHILNALQKTSLLEVNHLIWKYNFGVYTRNKYISSHYHILYYVKKGDKPTFNTFSRYAASEKDGNNGSLNYDDREDVWIINKEYKPNQIKNKNELPKSLLIKIIQYSSNEGDLVCDLFLGSFSTAKVALGLNRKATGFELNKRSFDYQLEQIKQIKIGELLSEVRFPQGENHLHQCKRWSKAEIDTVKERYHSLFKQKTKKEIINILSKELNRGYFSILNAIEKHVADIDNSESSGTTSQPSLFE